MLDTVELVKLGSLRHDARNARRHSPQNLAAIRASLERFGQQKPIVVDQAGIVVAGNGTLEAARQLGWAKIAVVRSTLSAPELAAFAVADNRTAELAEWEPGLLARALAEMGELEPGLPNSLGWSDDDILAVLAASASPTDGKGKASKATAQAATVSLKMSETDIGLIDEAIGKLAIDETMTRRSAVMLLVERFLDEG